ncbi:transcription elongation factor [Fragilariopsis cylindrus CCMP1102]|uniref:Transcription elongation factor n=1 Tax=Fragilariopsis cylindrus CCMP1102 TaxID=635003 RepID=A0A1E7F8T5_9STRA|nr:transcription elongation factor [Fragilariopsis cylindrus CCMP1102]|eukprot:OEU14591.1 transcription elongation factor [Fragilariopsis cylindrus CCMP1102]
MATIKKIELIKQSMSKKVASGVEILSDDDIETLKDMLQQLESFDVNLEILTKTLIGTIVSKFKKHEIIGPTAKALVKKWKSIAKGEVTNNNSNNKGEEEEQKPAASAAKTAVAVAAAVKPKRRNSTNAATAEMREQWFSLQPYRQTTCQKLHDILINTKTSLIKQGINPDAIDHLVVERATDVEQSIQAKFLSNKTEYLSKARSLCFNIKKNSSLACQIILGQIPSKKLVDLSSEELVNDKKRKEIEERKKQVMDSNLLDWDTQNEDKINEMCGITGDLLNASLFTCGRCKSTKTTSTQKQTRSADEPMTVFVLCLACNNRWKFS